MKREKLVSAFGYGVKEANFHNRYGDSYVLVALRTRDENNNLTFSTIKSNGGGSKSRYVRFLTESDALKFIQEKLDNGTAYVPYVCRTERVLSLEDPEYGLYLPATEIPSNLVSPAKYDANGKKINNAQYIKSLTIDSVMDALNLYPTTFGNNQTGAELYIPWGDTKLLTKIFADKMDIDTGKIGGKLDTELLCGYCTARKTSDSMIHVDFYLPFRVRTGFFITPRGVNLYDWYNLNSKTKTPVTYVDPQGKVLKSASDVLDTYDSWERMVKFSMDISFQDFLQGIKKNLDAKNSYVTGVDRVWRAAERTLVSLLLKNFERDNSWVDKADKSFTDHFVALMKLLDTWYDEEYVDVDL